MSIRLELDPKPICAILLAGTTLFIAACGGSSSTTGTTEASRGGQRAADLSSVRSYSKAHHDVVSNGVLEHRPRHGTGGAEVNDENPARVDAGGRLAATGGNPCTLVTQAQAQAILGKAVDSPVEAPLGPTCIYRPAGAQSFVTMTVESANFAAIKARIRHRTQFGVSGHTAYCGTYGQPMVFVPLARGRVLTVTAPCVIGARFAATAVPRLGA